jgi:hypothetical protein
MSVLSSLSSALISCGQGALVGASISTLVVAIGATVVAPPVGLAIGLVMAGTIFGCALFTLKNSPVSLNSNGGAGLQEMDTEFTQSVLNAITALSTELQDIDSEDFLKGFQYDITYGVASILGSAYYESPNTSIQTVVNTYFNLMLAKIAGAMTHLYDYMRNQAFTGYTTLQFASEISSSLSLQNSGGVTETVPVAPSQIGVHYVEVTTPTGSTLAIPIGMVFVINNNYVEYFFFSPTTVFNLFPTSSYTHNIDIYNVVNGTIEFSNTINYTSLTQLGTEEMNFNPSANPQFQGGILGNVMVASSLPEFGTETELYTATGSFNGYQIYVNSTVTNSSGNLVYVYPNCPNCQVSPFLDSVLNAVYYILNSYNAVLDYAEEVYDYYESQGYTSQQALDTLGVLNASILTKLCTQSLGSTLKTASLLTQLQNKLPNVNVLLSDYGIEVSDLTVNIAGNIVTYNNVIVELTEGEATISPSGYKVKYGGIVYDPYSGLVFPIPAGAIISSSKNTYVWRNDLFVVQGMCYHAPVPSNITGLSDLAYINTDEIVTFNSGQTYSVNATIVNDDSAQVGKANAITPNTTFTYVPYVDAYFTYTPNGTAPAYVKTTNPDYLIIALLLVLLIAGLGIGYISHNNANSTYVEELSS